MSRTHVTSYIDEEIIANLRSCSDDQPIKLIEHCLSVNNSYTNENYTTVAILIRAILDYIPTVFGFTNTAQVYSQLKNKKSFKNALRFIDESNRNIADDALHTPAQVKEILKIKKLTVDSLHANLILVLTEVADQISREDLREAGSKLILKEAEAEKAEIIPQRSQLETFEEYIEKETWSEDYFDGNKVWICDKDNLYQIHNRDDYGDFTEPWTQVYPDKFGSGKHSVDLVYSNTPIKRFTFVYCDGGRISVALPEIDVSEVDFSGKDKEDKRIFYWDKSSIDYSLTQLIGSFYIYKNIQGVSNQSSIEIR